MFKKLKNQRAQATLTEYAVVIFIVVAMLTAMGTYVKRALQGRINDARDTAFQTIKDRTAGKYNGVVYKGYEPYYLNTVSLVNSGESSTSRLFQGGAGAKEYNSESRVITNSETAPPREAD